MRIFHFRRILPAGLAPISFGTLGVVSAKYDRGAESNRQHPFVEVLCSDITESGEILNLSALVREPLPPAFHRLSKVQKRPLPAARGWRRSTERRHSLVRHRKISIAACERRLGLSDMAARLETSAQKLKRRFEEAFWCDEINMYALALDGEKRQCRVRTSNAGQVLMSGIASPERARRVADSLIRPQFLSGWGIRTVAIGEVRYNPMSYHNGSIWPHDNALIAMGFAHYGFKAEVNLVFQGLVSAASRMELRRLPELFCGFRRVRGNGPTRYPVACTPQAWASAAPLALLQASLGIRFELDDNRIRLVSPTLPSFLDMVVLRDVRIAENMVDFAVYRQDHTVSIEILRNEGRVEISMAY